MPVEICETIDGSSMLLIVEIDSVKYISRKDFRKYRNFNFEVKSIEKCDNDYNVEIGCYSGDDYYTLTEKMFQMYSKGPKYPNEHFIMEFGDENSLSLMNLKLNMVVINANNMLRREQDVEQYKLTIKEQSETIKTLSVQNEAYIASVKALEDRIKELEIKPVLSKDEIELLTQIVGKMQ